MGQNEELVMVLSVADPFVVALAKSILDDADIFYVNQGEVLQDLVAPGRIGGFNQVAGPVEIFVSPKDEAQARELLEDIELPPSESSDASGDGDEEA